jgi:hypothetical protein
MMDAAQLLDKMSKKRSLTKTGFGLEHKVSRLILRKETLNFVSKPAPPVKAVQVNSFEDRPGLYVCITESIVRTGEDLIVITSNKYVADDFLTLYDSGNSTATLCFYRLRAFELRHT